MSNLSISRFTVRAYVECFVAAIFPFGVGLTMCIIGLIFAPWVGGILFTLVFAALFFFALFSMLNDVTFEVERYRRTLAEEQRAKKQQKQAEENVSTEEPLPEVEEPYFEDDKVALDEEDYDFYENNTFDPFLATLNDEERNEFSELFILKLKGKFPELPDYEVNGDNREFFLKFFIHLGIYRSDISSSLLAKMYQYSLKI